MSAYTDGYRQGLADRKNGALLNTPEMIAQWAAASQDWKSGWGAGYDEDQEEVTAS